MAKKSSIEKNNRRARLVKKYTAKRTKLLAVANDMEQPGEVRFEARMKLAKIPRNANPTRLRNRCELTGRARGNYRKFKLSRIKFRELASRGEIPGVTKASW